MIGQKDRTGLVRDDACELLTSVELPSSDLSIRYREISFLAGWGRDFLLKKKKGSFFLAAKGTCSLYIRGKKNIYSLDRWEMK